MTLTLALTVLGIWVLVSVPSSLLIASFLSVGGDREAAPVAAAESATRKVA